VWCGSGSLGGLALDIAQRHQEVTIEVRALGRKRSYEGKVNGNVATVLTSQGATALAFELQGERLRIVQARESLSMLKGEALTRARGGACPA